MRATIKTFLTARLMALELSRNQAPPYRRETIFFGDLPRDYLKDNDYAAQCLVLQDRLKRDGRLIGKAANAGKTALTLTRRRYRREILVRCLFYAATYEDLWGTPTRLGLVDQFEREMAKYKALADAGNNLVQVELQEAARPWNSDAEADRIKRRPHLAIVRIGFVGGLQATSDVPLIQSVDFADPTII